MSLERIIHVAQIALEPTTGMGRIACEWQAAARRSGLDFIHIGPEEVGPVAHRLLFPLKARKLAEKLPRQGTLLLIHEPCAWAFRGVPRSKVAFSHGIELRGAEIESTFQRISPKSRLTRPVLRWLGRRGLVAMDAILVSNQDDKKYLVARRIMSDDCVRVFRNGVDPFSVSGQGDPKPEAGRTVVFNGSWLPRKGIDLLVQAALLLGERGIHPRWLLIGTGKSKEEVLGSWPTALHADLTILPNFQRDEELSLISGAEIFVLPSYFEGQPLALLQAMAAGLCCITSDCCGQKDLIRHGENGLLFPPGDERRLADLIQQAWEDEALRRGLGRAARACMAERTWASVADEVIGRIEECWR